jgi:hypothetical protein
VTAKSAPVSDARVFVRNPKVEEAPLSGELMLFDPGSSRFFVLNQTMAFIWRRCDGRHTLATMMSQLTEEFRGVERATAEPDLHQALTEMVSLGLAVEQLSEEPAKA